MNAHSQSLQPRLSAAQLSELALEAAIEVQNFMSGQGRRLGYTKKLLESLIATMNAGGAPAAESKIDLAYLPIYQSAVGADSDIRPQRISDFTRLVQHTLHKFSEADEGDQQLLKKLQEFCLSVHEQALSQRLDDIRTNRPQISYARRPF